MMELNKHNRGTIEPLYHSNTASFVIQKASLAFQHSHCWKAKEAFLIYYGVNNNAKPHKNDLTNL